MAHDCDLCQALNYNEPPYDPGPRSSDSTSVERLYWVSRASLPTKGLTMGWNIRGFN
jgi:hypothetical protein